MDKDGDSPPTFWFQLPIATRRRPPSPLLNPLALIITLPILAFLLIFFFLTPFLNHTSHLLKPATVKKSWDSLNIFLVLFAILCGILSRKNDDGDVPPSADDQVNQVVSSSRWGEYNDQDRKVISSSVREPVSDNIRLRRNSCSYPDLRQESLWDTGDNRFQHFDDFCVNLYPSTSGYLHQRSEVERENVSPPTLPVSEVERAESVYFHDNTICNEMEGGNFLYRSLPSRRGEAEREFSAVTEKEIPVDTIRYALAPPSPPPVVHLRRKQVKEAEFKIVRQSPVLPPPLPPAASLQLPSLPSSSPPRPPAASLQQKHKKIGDATKEIATAITSLYNQSKRKKKHRTNNIFDNATTLSPLSSSSSPEQAAAAMPPPPTPPPLPPPPFVFHNMFKKGTKQKRIHSIAVTSPPPPQLQPPQPPPPPPPPPPPSSIFISLFKSSGKSKRHNSSTAPLRPPPPPPPPSVNIKSGFITKRHSPALYPPPVPPLALSPALFTKCKSAESVQAYSNLPVISPRLSRRKSHTPPPATPPTTEPFLPRTSNKGKPPLPTKQSNYYERDDYHEYLNSGSQSPLYPIPPPLPPFQIPEMKFKVRGDFVSIRSGQSSVSNSPDRNDVDFSSLVGSAGGRVLGPVFFPSPDVNAKADSFISRLKDEWRLEKVKAKDGPWNAGPRPAIKHQ